MAQAKPKPKQDLVKLRQNDSGKWQALLWSGQYKMYFVMPMSTNIDKLACVNIAIAFLNKYEITN
jgi:hypothetical protein